MEFDRTFINMANENHANAMEWEEVYEIGRQNVLKAHRHRAEWKIERRKQNLNNLLAGLSCLGITVLMFIFMAIIVLIL